MADKRKDKALAKIKWAKDEEIKTLKTEYERNVKVWSGNSENLKRMKDAVDFDLLGLEIKSKGLKAITPYYEYEKSKEWADYMQSQVEREKNRIIEVSSKQMADMQAQNDNIVKRNPVILSRLKELGVSLSNESERNPIAN